MTAFSIFCHFPSIQWEAKSSQLKLGVLTHPWRDNKKGGDIDLYLVVENKENLFETKIKFLSRVKRELGEQKIDVVFNKDPNRLIEQEAKKWGIQL